jgi:uncharacterized protein (TIGR00251 family)
MIRFAVRAQPGARSDEIVGWTSNAQGGEMLKVRLRAAAVEGKANAALVEFLAESLGLRPRQVTIERGEKSREKLISADGLTLDELKRRTGG